MSYVDGTVYSHERVTFWTRPHSLVFTWPVLLALLLLLLFAGVIAVAHYCAPRRLYSPRARRRPALHPPVLTIAHPPRSGNSVSV